MVIYTQQRKMHTHVMYISSNTHTHTWAKTKQQQAANNGVESGSIPVPITWANANC